MEGAPQVATVNEIIQQEMSPVSSLPLAEVWGMQTPFLST